MYFNIILKQTICGNSTLINIYWLKPVQTSRYCRAERTISLNASLFIVFNAFGMAVARRLNLFAYFGVIML